MIQKAYTNNMGGKARGLYRLKELGLDVPDFIVIPYDVFKNVVERHNDPDILTQQLEKYKLDQQVVSRVEEALAKWDFPNQKIAVRSSILDEDGSDHSFAGMMDSYLNLYDRESVFEAIKKCAASAYSHRSITYREENELPSRARPAVLVQKQINATASGVIFTTSPIYPQEVAIHMAQGLGDKLVSGQVAADEFYYLKKSGKLHRCMTTDNLDFNNDILEDPSSREDNDTIGTLPDYVHQDLLDYAFAKAEQIEALYGPSDIEFCIKDDQFYFLQLRPITTKIPDVTVFDNSNIQESYCGVTTPLTFSFATRAYGTVYKQTMKVVGINQRTIDDYQNVLNNLLALRKGRIYYNINNWYRGLQLLPSFSQNKEDMEAMMGLEEPVDFVIDTKKSWREKIQLLPSLILNLSRLLLEFKRLKKRTERFKHDFNEVYRNFYRDSNPSVSLQEFIKRRHQLDELLYQWDVPIINDFKVMMSNGKVKRALESIGIKKTEAFLALYLSNDHEIESAFPTRLMIDLASEVDRDPELCKLIKALPQELHHQIKASYPEFYLKVEDFMDRYGDRTIGELKLETITMRVQPQIFYQYLKNLFGYHSIDKAPQNLQDTAKKELVEALDGKSFFTKRSVINKLHQLQDSIRRRESLRLDRTRLFGMYRTLYRQYASHLKNQDFIDQIDDIFYLTEDELINDQQDHFKELITERQGLFESYESQEVPSRIVQPYPPVGNEKPKLDDNELMGQGCHPGEATGEVLVITNPTDDLNVKDKIIVAQRTDPGWCALFPSCRAVIIEKGSMLSHSVILLRELGIPTIINVPAVTKILKTGQEIKMNGSTGHIQIIQRTTKND
ncbi:PEP/pyruvate-binding domain-containing protein [Nonlabens ponticola]|uniref:Phosphoenolpyruvate synthase n=1 Tax=Nonlabens ponticola TaxID=2496866 RepID=A0A3S9N0K2_9FLAO|nr:PEP/pyruvate-binding domain-containing protein [Nonlabens ponticola]AZQ44919.1 hypothetical protein EJ995_12045 [Nonlabens ponticola]